MKRVLAIAGICGVLVLDWLALDDITTGRQPTFVLTRRVLPRTRVGGGAARLRFVTRCDGEVRPDMRPRGTP